MGFLGAIGSFYRRAFDFQTRSSRSEFWWVKLYKTIVYFILFMGMGITAEIFGGVDTEAGDLIVGIAVGVMVLFYVVHLIPSIALAVRRFHDQDQSGWMFLLRLIPFYIGWIVLHVFMCLKGTYGDNQYGTDPLGDSVFDTFD